MPFRCSIYGLGVVANRIVTGVPAVATTSDDVHISFGSLPSWLYEVSGTQIETYVADYNDECGNPVLRMFSMLDGGYYRFCYADQTEFVIDRAGTEIWAKWIESLTLEPTATYLLVPVMWFCMPLRVLV